MRLITKYMNMTLFIIIKLKENSETKYLLFCFIHVYNGE